jgi:hypothetical protein
MSTQRQRRGPISLLTVYALTCRARYLKSTLGKESHMRRLLVGCLLLIVVVGCGGGRGGQRAVITDVVSILSCRTEELPDDSIRVYC